MRTAPINIRAHPEQRDLIDQACDVLGKNRSDFILEVACERAQAVMLDQVFFSLNEKEFAEFAEILDAPVQHNRGLERLMAVSPPWNTHET